MIVMSTSTMCFTKSDIFSNEQCVRGGRGEGVGERNINCSILVSMAAFSKLVVKKGGCSRAPQDLPLAMPLFTPFRLKKESVHNSEMKLFSCSYQICGLVTKLN